MPQPKRLPRVCLRIFKLLVVILLAIGGYLLFIKLTGRSRSLPARAAWLKWNARNFLWALGVEPGYTGNPPSRGVLISNHISYLDILVHAARTPLVFISKAEVARWPLFGMLTRWAGTLFIRREFRGDVVRIASEMRPVIQSGVVLAFFPEGTSSDGGDVLPFRASLLAPLVEHCWPVTPAFLRYELEPGDGAVADDVAYYRPETEFGPHLLSLLGRRKIRARLTYGAERPGNLDRKALAAQLRDEVRALGGLAETTAGV